MSEPLTPLPHQDRLELFAQRFLEINAQLNLSAARDLAALWDRHVVDSVKLLEIPELAQATSLLDLGTGGGLPGIPLAIARPELSVTLVDSVAKKLKAVDVFIGELGLTNARTLCGRAEELAHRKDLRQRFDVVVARAVAALPVLLEYGCAFVRPGGVLIAVKGPSPEEELAVADRARRALGLSQPRVEPYTVGGQAFTRIIYPVRTTMPSKYPRRTGIPAQDPL